MARAGLVLAVLLALLAGGARGQRLELAAGVSSQSFDDGSGPAANYGPGWNREWRIAAPAGQRVFLWFTSFLTEAGFDFVSVYDGSEADAARLLGRASGAPELASLRFTSSGGALLVAFASDAAGLDAGFEASYRALTLTAPTVAGAGAAVGTRGANLSVAYAPGEGVAWLDAACAGAGGPYAASAAVDPAAGAAHVLVPAGAASPRALALSCAVSARTAAGAVSPASSPVNFTVPSVAMSRPAIAWLEAPGDGTLLANVTYSPGADLASLELSCADPAGGYVYEALGAAPDPSGAPLALRLRVWGTPYPRSLSCTAAARARDGFRLFSAASRVDVPPGLAPMPVRGVGARLSAPDSAGLYPAHFEVPAVPLGPPLTLEWRVEVVEGTALFGRSLLHLDAPGETVRLDFTLEAAKLVLSIGDVRYSDLVDAFPFGRPVHVALTAGAGAAPDCRLYLNGALARSFPCAAIPNATWGPVAVGQDYNEGARRPDARGVRLADVRLWSAEKGPEEVAALAAGAPASAAGLELYLPLDAGPADESGRRRHGWLVPAGSPFVAYDAFSAAPPFPAGSSNASVPPGPSGGALRVRAVATAGQAPSLRETQGVLVNGSLYVFGGLCAPLYAPCDGPLAYRLDLAAGEPAWEALPPFARVSTVAQPIDWNEKTRVAATTDGAGRVWLHGGVLWDAEELEQAAPGFTLFDLENWRRRDLAPGPPRFGGCGVYYDKRVYYVFGHQRQLAGYAFPRSVYAYDTVANEWLLNVVSEDDPDNLGGRGYFACNLLGSRIYVYGGLREDRSERDLMGVLDLAAAPLRWRRVPVFRAAGAPVFDTPVWHWANSERHWAIAGGISAAYALTNANRAEFVPVSRNAYLFDARCERWYPLAVDGQAPFHTAGVSGFSAGTGAVHFGGVTGGNSYSGALHSADLNVTAECYPAPPAPSLLALRLLASNETLGSNRTHALNNGTATAPANGTRRFLVAALSFPPGGSVARLEVACTGLANGTAAVAAARNVTAEEAATGGPVELLVEWEAPEGRPPAPDAACAAVAVAPYGVPSVPSPPRPLFPPTPSPSPSSSPSPLPSPTLAAPLSSPGAAPAQPALGPGEAARAGQRRAPAAGPAGPVGAPQPSGPVPTSPASPAPSPSAPPATPSAAAAAAAVARVPARVRLPLAELRLDGTGSGGGPVRCRWAQLAGPPLRLRDAALCAAAAERPTPAPTCAPAPTGLDLAHPRRRRADGRAQAFELAVWPADADADAAPAAAARADVDVLPPLAFFVRVRLETPFEAFVQARGCGAELARALAAAEGGPGLLLLAAEGDPGLLLVYRLACRAGSVVLEHRLSHAAGGDAAAAEAPLRSAAAALAAPAGAARLAAAFGAPAEAAAFELAPAPAGAALRVTAPALLRASGRSGLITLSAEAEDEEDVVAGGEWRLEAGPAPLFALGPALAEPAPSDPSGSRTLFRLQLPGGLAEGEYRFAFTAWNRLNSAASASITLLVSYPPAPPGAGGEEAPSPVAAGVGAALSAAACLAAACFSLEWLLAAGAGPAAPAKGSQASSPPAEQRTPSPIATETSGTPNTSAKSSGAGAGKRGAKADSPRACEAPAPRVALCPCPAPPASPTSPSGDGGGRLLQWLQHVSFLAGAIASAAPPGYGPFDRALGAGAGRALLAALAWTAGSTLVLGAASLAAAAAPLRRRGRPRPRAAAAPRRLAVALFAGLALPGAAYRAGRALAAPHALYRPLAAAAAAALGAASLAPGLVLLLRRPTSDHAWPILGPLLEPYARPGLRYAAGLAALPLRVCAAVLLGAAAAPDRVGPPAAALAVAALLLLGTALWRPHAAAGPAARHAAACAAEAAAAALLLARALAPSFAPARRCWR
eukprot:tig00000385_g24742.t1